MPLTRFCFSAALCLLVLVVSGCTAVSQKVTSMTRGPMLRPSATSDNCGVEGCDTASPRAGGNGQKYANGSNCRVDSRGRRIQATPCHFEACMVPRELRKTALPEYRVEPPDVLLIEAVNNLRPAQAPILAGEPLLIQAIGTPKPNPLNPQIGQAFKPIDGTFFVGTDGYVNLGPQYGQVLCAGQQLHEIQRRIETHLDQIIERPQVQVTLPNPSTKQMVAGPHLVRLDGTVGLGVYGSVYVLGMTLTETKLAIERHLSAHLHAPEVSVDVLEYRSKWYYVIADGGGAGERVYRLPSTGNETVLDAVAQINGLPSVACKGKIWVARPGPDCCGPDQVLPVDWNAIARGAKTCTNYQLLPGDRLYVQADPFIRFDTNLARITAPFERILGIALLGRTFTNFNSLNN